MVAIMKAMVYVRHRVYVKLRIFVRFIEEGGLQQFCELLESTWDWAATVPPPPLSAPEGTTGDSKPLPIDPDAKLRKALETTLDSMLSILSFFLDGEPIMECPEYPILVVDHDDNRRWFRAGDLIVGLRLMALPTLQKIWESPLLVYSNSGLMQTFIACLGPIISAQHEARTTGALPGIRRHLPNLLEGHTPHSIRRRTEQRLTSPLLSNAFEAFDRAIGPSQTSGQSTTEVEPISLYVTELVNMGFSNEEANTVLRRYSNNLERATEYLLNTRLAERSRRALGAEGSVSADAQPAPSTDDGNAQAAATADDSNAQAAEA
ncbi:E3 ubiquitin-protein ligase tom1, partial [Coemansia sp. RSA 520]